MLGAIVPRNYEVGNSVGHSNQDREGNEDQEPESAEFQIRCAVESLAPDVAGGVELQWVDHKILVTVKM